MVIVHLASDAHTWLAPWALQYVGPDVFLPITSALAAIAGVVLMFWNRLAGAARKLLQMVTRRPK